MIKFKLKNRHNEKIAGIVENLEGSRLVFVVHGLSGYKEQLHIENIAKLFVEKDYVAVRFDCTHSFNESEGSYENATLTGYLDDLEDVVEWAKQQSWFRAPFALAGHSMGGYAVSRYSQIHNDLVETLISFAPVVSGKKMLESRRIDHPDIMKKWQKTGTLTEESRSRPGFVKNLNWHPHNTDAMRHDLMDMVEKITAETLVIYGDSDFLNNQGSIHDFYNGLITNKKEIIVSNGDHDLSGEKQQTVLKKSIEEFVS